MLEVEKEATGRAREVKRFGCIVCRVLDDLKVLKFFLFHVLRSYKRSLGFSQNRTHQMQRFSVLQSKSLKVNPVPFVVLMAFVLCISSAKNL